MSYDCEALPTQLRSTPPPVQSQAGRNYRQQVAARSLYRAYMVENGLNVWLLAHRLNEAWRRRGQKPRMNWDKLCR
jgi:hypothetical protein